MVETSGDAVVTFPGPEVTDAAVDWIVSCLLVSKTVAAAPVLPHSPVIPHPVQSSTGRVRSPASTAAVKLVCGQPFTDSTRTSQP